MVFNNTKVIPSKLNGHQIKNGRPVEILLIRETSDGAQWEALIKGLKKVRIRDGNGIWQRRAKGHFNRSA